MQRSNEEDQEANHQGFLTSQELYAAAQQRLGFLARPSRPHLQANMSKNTKGNPKPESVASDDEQPSSKVNPLYKRIDKLDKEKAAYIATKAKKHQQEGPRVYFKPGIDSDGDPDRPDTWLVYDPEILPDINATDYHDSSGTSGFPCNVVLGDRAVVAVLDAGISENNRRWRWPGNFGADGRVPSKYRNTGRCAATKLGDLIRIKLAQSKGSQTKYITFSGDPQLPENKAASLSGKVVTITPTPSGGTPSNILAKPVKRKTKDSSKTQQTGGSVRKNSKGNPETPKKRGNSDTPDSSAKKLKVFGALKPTTLVVSSDSERSEASSDDPDGEQDPTPLGMAPVLARRMLEEISYAREISSDAITTLVNVTTLVKKLVKKKGPITDADLKQLLSELHTTDVESGETVYKANLFAERLTSTTSFMTGLSELLADTPNLCTLMTENIDTGAFTDIEDFISSGAATDIPTVVTTTFGQFSRQGYGEPDIEDDDGAE
jgi:hypothetical protein